MGSGGVSQKWAWCDGANLVIPAFMRLKQNCFAFKANLGYIMRHFQWQMHQQERIHFMFIMFSSKGSSKSHSVKVLVCEMSNTWTVRGTLAII